MSYSDCTSVSVDCPVEQTIYGYAPSLGGCAFFVAYFAVFTIVTLGMGLRLKTYTFGILMALGALSETIGYVGRVIMHSNPWSNTGFEMQICCLIFAPSFFAAAIYFMLKNMVRAVGPQFSPLNPKLYPWIFITCDIVSLLLQAVGGGIAASATTDSGSNAGGRIMLAGIVFQVATFTALYTLVIMFAISLKKNISSLTNEQSLHLHSRNFKIFGFGILAASFGIYVRCVYRIAELAGGWANSIMRDEPSFMILDGAMVAFALLVLTVCHPGIFFTGRGDEQIKEKELGRDSCVSEAEPDKIV